MTSWGQIRGHIVEWKEIFNNGRRSLLKMWKLFLKQLNSTQIKNVTYGHQLYRMTHLLANLGWVLLLLFHCLPYLAWAGGNLADLAVQLGKIVKHHKSKSIQPSIARRWVTLYTIHNLLQYCTCVNIMRVLGSGPNPGGNAMPGRPVTRTGASSTFSPLAEISLISKRTHGPRTRY